MNPLLADFGTVALDKLEEAVVLAASAWTVQRATTFLKRQLNGSRPTSGVLLVANKKTN
jgi:hypothetical protein